jgi:N-methylhydantoinase A
MTRTLFSALKMFRRDNERPLYARHAPHRCSSQEPPALAGRDAAVAAADWPRALLAADHNDPQRLEAMTVTIGVDVGGTFTDLVAVDSDDGTVRVGKHPSTPLNPDAGVLEIVDRMLTREDLGRANYFLHGTTTGLNALVERKGAKVGILTTRGFRDVLELRRGMRPHLFGLLWTPTEPLVPRNLRLEVTERVLSDGTVEKPLAESEVAAAAKTFIAEGVDSVAVVFINSYASPDHEARARQALISAGFAGTVSLSHEVTGEYGEYERTSTTAVDAYLRPVVSSYFQRLVAGLKQRGFQGECLVTRSGGGAMTFGEAELRPFETVMSGPVAGISGVAQLYKELGEPRSLIAADVGGTTFDTSLVLDGQPHLKYEGFVADLPLQTTWVDVRSIGSGGGSIASVDEGLMKVGPESAGANPGPVSYGRGGVEPTVTDAMVVLGMAPTRLANNLELDVQGARAAVGKLATKLGIGVDAAAEGILAIASAAMAGAIRQISIEIGEDPRAAALVAYGGAGPMFGTLLARELEIGTVIVPRAAGGFSAWGLLCSDIVRSLSRTHFAELSPDNLGRAIGALDALHQRLADRGELVGAGVAVREDALDLRYAGQDQSLTVRIQAGQEGTGWSPDKIRNNFAAEYHKAFGHVQEERLEMVAVRATSRLPLETDISHSVNSSTETLPGMDELGEVDAFSFTAGKRMAFSLVHRHTLSAGSELRGPAIVADPTTTIYVDSGFTAKAHANGSLILTYEELPGHDPR